MCSFSIRVTPCENDQFLNIFPGDLLGFLWNLYQVLASVRYENPENFSSVSLIVSKKWSIENLGEMRNCYFLSLEPCSDTLNFTNKVQRRNISAFPRMSLNIFFLKVILTFWKWWIFSKMRSKCTKKFFDLNLVPDCPFSLLSVYSTLKIEKKILKLNVGEKKLNFQCFLTWKNSFLLKSLICFQKIDLEM